MEQLQVDGEYVGWAKRTQYIKFDFSREIRLYYTWRGTPDRKSKVSPLSAKNEKQPFMDSERSLALVTKQLKLTANVETVSFSNK
jgi:hypothetical protein